jgi:hypothetical protein
MLLAAWNSADLRHIQNAIDQTGAVETTCLSGAEVERIELIREIGSVMRQWMAGHKTAADLKASLGLLHHIANVRSSTSADAGLAFN